MKEWINICYPYVSGVLEIIIQLYIFNRFFGKKGKPAVSVCFTFIGLIAVNLVQLDVWSRVLIFISILAMYGFLVLKINYKSAFLYAVLIIEIMRLCYGVSNSAAGLLSSFLYSVHSEIFGLMFMLIGSIFALGLACLCYHIILKYLINKDEGQNQYILIILTPLLLIFIVSEYIGNSIYGNTIYAEQSLGGLNISHLHNVQMLVVQLLGIISIFTIIYAYQRLSESFFIRSKLLMMEQEGHFQRQYVEEAKFRYEQTRALRHDMKNHILIVKGLLESNEPDKAHAYIGDLDMAADLLSFSFQTNNPVIDILLKNKAALAKDKGISVDSSLKLPFPCAINDMDFCIILSNALDNAIIACEGLGTKVSKYIKVSGSIQEKLILIEVENTFNGNRDIKKGIGLSNIEYAAKKYGGAMDIHIQNDVFCLSVLLIC